MSFTIFPTSPLANRYLKKLRGVEIGASEHNSYRLQTINVDFTDEITVYKEEEINMCGKFCKVDIVADAMKLPFKDKTFDFVLSSHMLEHHWQPIGVISEWVRVARKYIFITVPRMDLTFDKDKTPTTLLELQKRHIGEIKKVDETIADDHWNIWGLENFKEFCNHIAERLDLEIVEFQEIDDKVGNGMTVLFEIRNKPWYKKAEEEVSHDVRRTAEALTFHTKQESLETSQSTTTDEAGFPGPTKL